VRSTKCGAARAAIVGAEPGMQTRTPHNPVTIIVPVYGDLPSLVACVKSLIQTVDQFTHRVLLVNDVGPEADLIEDALLHLIRRQPGIRYERNPRNLGFVKTCNRAVAELDGTRNDILLLNSDTVVTPGFIEELSSVLHASQSHATVCPRSDNATIASLPYRLADPAVGRSPARTMEVRDAIAAHLPRYSVAPASMGFCILIRRDLIEKYGLFDEVFSPGYGEENDFCLRMATRGYVSVIAHRALVFHEGSRSFVGVRRNIIRARHERIVTRRHPAFREAVERYLWSGTGVADIFADVLVPRPGRPGVLVFLGEFCGEELQALLVGTARELADSGAARVTVAAHSRGARCDATRSGLDVVARDSLAGTYELAVCSSGLTGRDLAALDRSAPRLVRVTEAEQGGPTVAHARTVEPEDFAIRLPIEELTSETVVALTSTQPDLDRLQLRHSRFTGKDGLPTADARKRQSMLRRMHHRGMATFPTVTTLAEWALLRAGRALRSLRARGSGR
jgi:GT2 family glycosyltransferase